MCGRYVLKAKPADLIKVFGLDECVDLKPRYNIPPGTNIAAIVTAGCNLIQHAD